MPHKCTPAFGGGVLWYIAHMYSLRALIMALVAFVPVAGTFAAATELPHVDTRNTADHIADAHSIQCDTSDAKEDVTFVSCGGFF